MGTDVVLVSLPLKNVRRRTEHLGLAYLAAGARSRGITVEILDGALSQSTIRELTESIVSANPLVVGFSAMQQSARTMNVIAKTLKERLPSVHVTTGGHFATFCHDRLLNDLPYLDSVVRGDGDLAFADLVRSLLARDDWTSLPNVTSRRGNEIVSIPAGPLLDLDTLPFPARDTSSMALKISGLLSISSARGCYGQCTFCSIREFYGLQRGAAWRVRSIRSVIDEIEYLSTEYGCDRFHFVDDSFVASGRERAHAFADEVLRRGLKIKFELACRVNDVDRELFLHLKDAGLCVAAMGVESGSQTQLNRFRKGTTVEQASHAISILRELNIEMQIYYMMFDPDSTRDECIDSLRFLMRERLLNKAAGYAFCVHPYDGTALCESLRREGRLRGYYLDGYSYTWKDPLVGAFVKAVKPIWRCLMWIKTRLTGDARAYLY